MEREEKKENEKKKGKNSFEEIKMKIMIPLWPAGSAKQNVKVSLFPLLPPPAPTLQTATTSQTPRPSMRRWVGGSVPLLPLPSSHLPPAPTPLSTLSRPPPPSPTPSSPPSPNPPPPNPQANQLFCRSFCHGPLVSFSFFFLIFLVLFLVFFLCCFKLFFLFFFFFF